MLWGREHSDGEGKLKEMMMIYKEKGMQMVGGEAVGKIMMLLLHFYNYTLWLCREALKCLNSCQQPLQKILLIDSNTSFLSVI